MQCVLENIHFLNVTRACCGISISVLAKCYSFDVIVILLHTLGHITACLFAICIFSSVISATIRGEQRCSFFVFLHLRNTDLFKVYKK